MISIMVEPGDIHVVPRYARLHSSSYGGDVGARGGLPIACALCYFSWHLVIESADRWAGLAGNFSWKVLFEKNEPEALEETIMLQNRVHPIQQKILDLLVVHSPPQLSSAC
jgi:hypothetical protein